MLGIITMESDGLIFYFLFMLLNLDAANHSITIHTSQIQALKTRISTIRDYVGDCKDNKIQGRNQTEIHTIQSHITQERSEVFKTLPKAALWGPSGTPLSSYHQTLPQAP